MRSSAGSLPKLPRESGIMASERFCASDAGSSRDELDIAAQLLSLPGLA